MVMLNDELKRIFERVRRGELGPDDAQRAIRTLRSSGRHAVVITRPGGIDDIELCEVEPRAPGTGEVTVEIRAFALNFGDLLCVKGLYPSMPAYPFTPGFELSGVVQDVGPGVTRVSVGDAVVGVSGPEMGAQAATITLHERAVVRKPANVSFEEACAFPVVYLTMRRAFDLATVKRGDTILIQTAAGGTGLLGVQLAQAIGAEVYATAGSAAKLQYLASLGVRHLVNYREDDFAERFRTMTGGRGLDVIINTLSGDAPQKSVDLLAPGGRYVELAMTGMKAGVPLDVSRLVENQSIHSLDLRKLLLREPVLIAGYLDAMVDVLQRGEIKPTVGLVRPFERVREAYRALEDRETVGKVVVTVPASASRTTEVAEPVVRTRDVGTPPSGYRPIAIIGMAGRFPGAPDVQQLWQNLAAGRDCIGELPRDRWDVAAVYDPDPKRLDTTHCPHGGFLDGIDQFDPLFFNVSGREALSMDPQHRLFLEESWKALEDAGYATEAISGTSCGVFVGVGASDYWDALTRGGLPHDAQSFWGNEPSVLTARLSYLLNLKGAAVAVNTACSSSLTALHLACQSLQTGESEIAIAGGAFVRSTPHFHVLNSNAGMLSPDGRCKTFDDAANGYVPGEAVAVIILKDLEKALRDGDHIYGVIRSSGINQDGRTNGITAPSSLSQTQLELDVYRKGQIDPSTIDYVEAHGTGTKLGDPIEIEALSNAFRQFTDAKRFCGIGSVKTNIGHTVAAAGVAGVIKVLLSMQHGALPPSLHFKRPNEHIRFDESPFRVITALTPWPLRSERPRRAAVSSFGFSGTNAHVVLDGPPASAARALDTRPAHLVVLTARTQSALERRALDLSLSLDSRANELELGDVAYTLHLGRRAFPLRAAFVVESMDELRRKLRELASGVRWEGLQLGDCKGGASPIEFDAKSVLDRIAAGSLVGRDYAAGLEQLGAAFVAGMSLAWGALYATGRFRRVSLPAYPFERKRYWPEEAPKADIAAVGARVGSFVRRRRIDAGDPLVAHHLVNGQKVLPGVGHLALVLEVLREEGRVGAYSFADVVWLQPVVVEDSGLDVEIAIEDEGGKLRFELRGATSEARVVCSKGRLVEASSPRSSAKLDLDGIRARSGKCVEGPVETGAGVSRGPFFRALSRLWTAEHEALGELRVPTDQREASRRFSLSPSLMDAALESAAGITGAFDRSRVAVPFAAERIDIWGPLPEVGYAHVTAGDVSGTCSVTVTDEDGEVRARIVTLSLREIADPLSKLMFVPTWVEEAPPHFHTAPPPGNALIVTSPAAAGAARAIAAECGPASALVMELRGDGDEAALERFVASSPSLQHVWFFGGVQNAGGDPADLARTRVQQEQGVVALYHLTRALVRAGYAERQLTLTIVTRNGSDAPSRAGIVPGAAAVRGFARSLSKEISRWIVTSIDLDASDAVPYIEAGAPSYREIVLRDGKSLRRILRPATLPRTAGPTFRQRGVYLIVGGAGGIGLALARHLAARYQAKIALVGRRPQNEAISGAICELEALGGGGMYITADATDAEALAVAVDAVRARFGTIHGAFHSAIVLSDKTIAQMSEDSLRSVLAPKVLGSASLYRALRRVPLDFLVFLSSAQAFVGSAGQSNYAAASAFEDAFAHELAARGDVASSVIDWGYWGEVGVVATEVYGQRLAAQGVHGIKTREGLEAIERILAARVPHVAVLKGAPALLASVGVELVRAVARGGEDVALPSADRGALARWVSAFEALDRFGARWVWAIVGRATGLGRARLTCTREEIRHALTSVPMYARCVDALLAILERDGRVRLSADVVHVPSGVDTPTEEACALEEQELIVRFPEVEPQIRLLGACLRRLEAILAGRVSAVDVLFSGATKDLVKRAYSGNVVSDHFNEVMATWLAHDVRRHQARGAADPIVIVEVGAGTGSTSAKALEAIAGAEVRYRYTDLSKAFVQAGKDQFGGRFPFATFERLDIERSPEEQGFAESCADVVVATNVLHATRDVSRSLAHVRRMLRPGGLLLLNELTGLQNFTSLTFGLLEGWWLFDDARVRLPHGPLLGVEQWTAALSRAGFSVKKAIGLVSDRAEPLAQHVLVAIGEGQPMPVTASNERTQPTPVESTSTQRPLAARTELEVAVLGCVAEVLRVDPAELDANTPYSEFGVDSLLAVDIIAKINESLGVDFKATDLFNYPTVARLVTEILANAPSSALGTAASAPAADGPPSPVPTAQSAASKQNSAPATVTAPKAVAIIGISGRFPGAPDVETFWNNLAAGREAVSETSRWNPRDYYDPDRGAEGKSYCKRAGLMDDVHRFDALFFNISPREAQLMDPQHRLFLEEAWRSLEDAGYSGESLTGVPCSVFVGCGAGDYGLSLRQAGIMPEAYTFSGSSAAMLPARIAYYLNLKGASVAVDTACSSALVAIHLACESIRHGASTMAIAGGVTVMSTPEFHVSASRAGMLSPEGRCKTFDASADGFVPGEAVGVIVLKDLEAALRDGDHVYGTIIGSVTNQDGKTNGITSPSGPSQTALALDLFERFGVDPSTIGYVEAHGTGTKLGDPIEVVALTRAFRKYTAEKRFCALGSVKTNVGHTLAAAGVVGLLKALLCLQRGVVPPSLNVKTTNPLVELEESPFFVNDGVLDLAPRLGTTRRRALVSSFGFSGTNAQVLLDEAPPSADIVTGEPPRPCLVPLSAATLGALTRKVEELRRFAERRPEASLRDAASTLLGGRTHFAHRAVFVASDWSELARSLSAWSPADACEASTTAPADAVAAMAAVRAATTPSAERGALEALGRLYASGAGVDHGLLYAGEGRRKVSLPTYPFDGERHLPPELDRSVALRDARPAVSASVLHPLVHRNASTLRALRFETDLSAREDVVAAHRVLGNAVLPATAYLEMARAAGAFAAERFVVGLRDVRWIAPLVIDAARASVGVSLKLEPLGESLSFIVESDDAVVHACGELVLDGSDVVVGSVSLLDADAIRRRCHSSVDGDTHYRRFEGTPLAYGAPFRVVRRVDVGKGEALATLEARVDHDQRLFLSPTVLDGALQTVIALGEARDADGAFLPVSIDKVWLRGAVPARALAHVSRRSEGPEDVRRFDLWIADETGYVVVEIIGLTLKRMRSVATVRSGTRLTAAAVLESVASGALGIDEAERLITALADGIAASDPTANVLTADNP